MFGAFGAARYMQLREQAKRARHRTVSRSEFIALAMQNGMTARKARRHAMIAKAMGSSVLIGGELLKIGSGR